MGWNWEQEDWPNFRYDAQVLQAQERQFLLRAGELAGAFRHVDGDSRTSLQIELLSEEALQTAAIEGESLDRASVQSSLRGHFGLQVPPSPVRPQERGMAELMIALHTEFAEPLSHGMLWRWHEMVLAGTVGVEAVGAYRCHSDQCHPDPMQIVSSRFGDPRVHFEAPPSGRVPAEMDRFVQWFNETAPGGATPLSAVTRSAIAHLYFESIHPFEDGNGRIGRAIADKALAQGVGQPTLIALARTLESGRAQYYQALESASRDTEISGWLRYFGDAVLRAQRTSIELVEFAIAKFRFYQRHAERLNPRQQKVIARMFREGPKGFEGGLSAKNYLAIAKTSRATATRDLAGLVEMGALSRTGERRHARYALADG